MAPSLPALRRQICDVGQRMWLKGFGAGYDGNISARIDDRRVLCTPTGVLKGFLAPGALCVIGLDGRSVSGGGRHRPTSEINLHLQIYRQRPDVRAVIHAHPPYATAFCCAGVRLPEGVYPEADAMLGRVPMVDYFTPGDPALGDAVRQALRSDTNTVLMANHGSVSFGATLTDAYCRLEVLEAYCRILLLMTQLGRAKPISSSQMRALLKLKQARGLADERLADLASVGQHNDEFFSLLKRAPVGRTAGRRPRQNGT